MRSQGIIKKQLTVDEDPDGKLTKQLNKQALVLGQRAHMLRQKANETAADNSRLREQIDEQRAHKLTHLSHHKILCARQEELDSVVPQLMDQTSQDLHEGEKFHSKLLLSQHESAVHAQQQQRAMESIQAEVRGTVEDMDAIESQQYEAQQRQLQGAYVAGKQQRAALAHAEVRLGYLQWQTGWWEGEFSRLQQATGMELTFVPGEPVDVGTVTLQFSESQQRNDSLVSYLQQQQVEQMHLDKELRRLRARRREVQKEKSDENAASDAMGPSMQDQANEVWERCTASERQLCDCFSLAAAGLRQLATPSDLEHRMQHAAQDALAQDALLAEQAAVAAAVVAQEAAEAAAAEAAAAPTEEPAGEPAAESGAEGGEEQAEAEASTPFLTAVDTPETDGEAPPAADAPLVAAAAAAAEAATAAADVATAAAEAAAAAVTTLEPAQPPSTELLEVASKLEDPENATKTALLEHALALLAQQVQDLSQAAKRIARSPIESTEPQPPELLVTWARKGMVLEQVNVRDTFKQLTVEKAAQEKQRALREDIAAAQAAETKASKKSKLTLGKSKTSAAMVPKGAHLEQSRSVPLLH